MVRIVPGSPQNVFPFKLQCLMYECKAVKGMLPLQRLEKKPVCHLEYEFALVPKAWPLEPGTQLVPVPSGQTHSTAAVLVVVGTAY